MTVRSGDVVHHSVTWGPDAVKEIPNRTWCDTDWCVSPPLPSWAATVMTKQRFDSAASPAVSALKRPTAT